MADNKLAVVTGASSGIGYELARRAVEDGYALVIVADEEEIDVAAEKLRRLGGTIEALRADLATRHGVDTLWEAVASRDVDLFFANAGRALGGALHEQDWDDVKRLIDLNILQTTSMLHKIGRKMHARGEGRILVTGSIAGYVPGPYNAVYNGTKAYLDSLCYALQDEWKGGSVTLTCLMPGPTDTRIFHREGNDLDASPIGQSGWKDDPVVVARAGYDAMMAGEPGVAPGLQNKLVGMLSGIVPDAVLAQIHRMGMKPKDA